jgi:hypothetical protein
VNAAVDLLLAELQQHHVSIERRGDRLRMKAPAPPPDELLVAVRQHKPELLKLLPDSDRPTRAIVRFRMPGTPSNSWCTALGAPGNTRDELIGDVLQRWPHAEVLA